MPSWLRGPGLIDFYNLFHKSGCLRKRKTSGAEAHPIKQLLHRHKCLLHPVVGYEGFHRDRRFAHSSNSMIVEA